MKRTPNCSFSTRDGSPCGRKVTDGSQPPVCHIHAGKTNSPIIPSPDAPIDALKILNRLARNADPRVSLRAVDLLLSLRQPKANAVAPQYSDAFVAELTSDEKDRFLVLYAQVQAIKDAVYDRRPELRPTQELRYADFDEHPEPPGPSAATPAAPRELAPDGPAAPSAAIEIDGVLYLDGLAE